MKQMTYPITHGAVDFACAVLLFRFFRGHPLFGTVLLLYNFFAFAVQMPLGLLADRINRNHALAGAGMGLIALAFLPMQYPLLSASLAGLGNAAFHLGGGLETMNRSEHAAPLGLFVAPGALGLFLGTLYGKTALPCQWVPFVMLMGCILGVGRQKKSHNPLPRLPQGWLALLGLWAVVVLRSLLGFSFSFPWNQGGWPALALACAAVLGKGLGGCLFDRFGWNFTVLCTLIPAAVCLCLGKVPFLGILGSLLFQTTMPLTLWGAAKLSPQLKGFAFGLLTFGLFIGFLPVYFQWSLPLSPLFSGAVALLSGLLLLPLGRRLRA